MALPDDEDRVGSPSNRSLASSAPKHYSWDDRRKGLTTAEKICLRTRPRPTPECQQRMLKGDPETPAAARRKKRNTKLEKVTRIDHEPSPLEQEEERCLSILNRILPLPAGAGVPSMRKLPGSGRDGSNSPVKRKSAVTLDLTDRDDSSRMPSRQSPTGAARPTPKATKPLPTPSAGSQPNFGPASSSSGAVGFSMASPTSGKAGKGKDKDKADGDDEPQGPHLGGLLRRKGLVEFDATSDPDVANVVRLVQGATAQRIERQVGGKIVFVHVNENEGKAQVGLQSSCASQLEKSGHPLHVFRHKMLEKHGSIQEAFNSISVEVSRRLSMREWCEILSKAKFCSLMEARVIYELMDANHDGTLTLPELQLGIEAVAPVTSVETLRKRLICLGIPSMMQALSIMNGPGDDMTATPLSLPEFAACLKRVLVLQDFEHRALYDQLRDPMGASLSDLAAALAAISPCLLTEDMRPYLVRRHGTLEKAYARLQDEWLETLEGFVSPAAQAWHGLNKQEATRLFQFTDIDGSGSMDRSELLGVLELSRPSLNMEQCRRKVQQSHRCIEAALRDALTHEADGKLNDDLRFNVEELLEILEPLDMTKKEKVRLAKFLGATGEQGVTLAEFFKGVKLLTPSCVLEGIRLQLLRVHKRVTDAFKGILNHRAPMDRQQISEVLKSSGAELDSETMDGLMEVIDIRSTGYITLTEFLAAMRTSELGTNKRLPPKECASHSEKLVREDLAPLTGSVTELKRGLRTLRQLGGSGEWLGPSNSPPKPRGMLSRTISAPSKLQAKSPNPPPPPPDTGSRPPSTSSFSELRGVFHQQTLTKFSAALRGEGNDDSRRRKTLGSLAGYVHAEQHTLKEQEVALAMRYTTAKLEEEMNGHRRKILPRMYANMAAGVLPGMERSGKEEGSLGATGMLA